MKLKVCEMHANCSGRCLSLCALPNMFECAIVYMLGVSQLQVACLYVTITSETAAAERCTCISDSRAER
jgi:hypothetical protein